MREADPSLLAEEGRGSPQQQGRGAGKAQGIRRGNKMLTAVYQSWELPWRDRGKIELLPHPGNWGE